MATLAQYADLIVNHQLDDGAATRLLPRIRLIPISRIWRS
jgi:hypothetical protein